MKNYLFICLLLSTTVVYAQVNKPELQPSAATIHKTSVVNGDEVQDWGIDNNIDSLLSIWYLQRALQDTTEFLPYTISPAQITDVPDEVYIKRIKALPCIIDLPYNHIVRNQIIYYTQRIPEKAEMILGLAEFYLPQIEEILDIYDMPIELRAMAVIESALNPRAISRAKAKGMWQFMYSTARLYDLTMNSYVDERFDPIASTHAAARHMKDLYTIFGDWSLAIAAYNCGAGNVNKAIRRSGGKRNYWDIYPYLPRETRGYVPAFVAANYLLTYYKAHHLVPKKIYMPSPVDTFMVNEMLHFEQISEVISIPVDELRNYNPQYTLDIIPGTERPYVLRIPYEYSSAFAENEKNIYTFKDSLYFNPNIIKQVASRRQVATPAGRNKIIHRIREGETLGALALKYRVNIADIRYWNGIRGNMIRAGQKLIIYTKQSATKTAATTSTPKQPDEKIIAENNTLHTVKKGETLWSISQIYDNVTYYDLMKMNGLNKNSKIYPGDKIKVSGI